jgi:hypothetical protein
MEFDGESLDMLDDVDMDVDVNPLDDSNLMLEMNEAAAEAKINEDSLTNDNEVEDDLEEEEGDEEDDAVYADDAGSIVNAEGEVTNQVTAKANKRERTNAKAVECLDLDGNLIEVFRSGLAASVKLNIPQGDISLCCRGLKQSGLKRSFVYCSVLYLVFSFWL